MASDEPTTGQPFDVDMVRELAEVMTKHDLSEVDLDTDAGRLRLRRGPRTVAAAAPLSAPPAAVPAALPTPTAGQPVDKPKPSRSTLEIKSEAIGIFYARPKPEQDPYVKVGSKVTATTVIGLIEAMKMFNEITAGVSGTIAEVLVDNQQPVEYGTVLFRVDPS